MVELLAFRVGIADTNDVVVTIEVGEDVLPCQLAGVEAKVVKVADLKKCQFNFSLKFNEPSLDHLGLKLIPSQAKDRLSC